MGDIGKEGANILKPPLKDLVKNDIYAAIATAIGTMLTAVVTIMITNFIHVCFVL
jgi:hypothetical protein